MKKSWFLHASLPMGKKKGGEGLPTQVHAGLIPALLPIQPQVPTLSLKNISYAKSKCAEPANN